MIYLSVPGVPISTNHAYKTIRQRVGNKSISKRVLTEEGRAYKNETKAFIARTYPQLLPFFKPNVSYSLLIEFVFHGREELYCATWPEKAENRYKQLDVSNRTKLFEDALAASTGLDDRQNFNIAIAKTWHRDYASTNVWVWNREEEGSPIDDLIQQLKAATPQPHGAVPSGPTSGVQSPSKNTKRKSHSNSGGVRKRPSPR